MHILVIEDDPRQSHYIRNSLSQEGYSIDVCSSLDEVHTYMVSLNEAPQIIILDRMLGRNDGAILIPKLKEKYPDGKILVLSSLDMASEKARIIDLGADEYLGKPFALEELSARLRLILRRPQSSGSVEITVRVVGNLVVDLKTQHVTVGSFKLDLTRKEFQLITLLMEHPGRVFNRFQILDRVWEVERMTESNVVETAIKNLRRKLEETHCTARIESKRNVGYWIEA
ncbi:MAG: response regulator transcription factor [Bdellovibrionales bacterium]|nr:response regulator transcription factor [Bdellovibrionales bacterium]